MRGNEAAQTIRPRGVERDGDRVPWPTTKEVRYRLMAAIRIWRANSTRVYVIKVTLDDWCADEGLGAGRREK
ncbi:MAG: hypothetical protein OXC83_07980 [Chloroflexi bacterium]|nr:hypothetical protein [Chloroflexota bacterium]